MRGKRRKMKTSWKGCLFDGVVLAILCIVVCLVGTKCAHAGLSECIDATCRVHNGRVVGSGCCIQISDDYVWVLTNAHVATQSRAWCEFYRAGHASRKMEGQVAYRDQSIDAAIIAIHKSHFQGHLPPAIPVAAANYKVQPGETITSVGCAEGHWPSAWRGHAIGYSGTKVIDLRFRPAPEGGRSGSAIFDAEGTRIVALLKQRNSQSVTDQTQGIATYCWSLHKGINTAVAKTNAEAAAKTEDAGYVYRRGYCDPNGGSCEWGWQRQQPQQQQPQQQQPQNNWPTLPSPSATVDVETKVDLSPVNERLDALNENVGALLIEIRADREQPPEIPAPDVTPVVQEQAAEIDALKQADATAAAERTQLAEAVQGAVDIAGAVNTKVDEVAAQQQAVADNIKQHGGLQARVEARMAAVEARVGEDAGKVEKAKEYLKDWFSDRIRNDGTVGWIRGAVILLIVVFLFKDVKDKVTKNDPLFIQDPIGELKHAASDLRSVAERIRDRFDRSDPDPNDPDPAATARGDK